MTRPSHHNPLERSHYHEGDSWVKGTIFALRVHVDRWRKAEEDAPFGNALLLFIDSGFGIGSAVMSGRLLAGLLYGAKLEKPLTLVSAAVSIALVALADSLLSARRAAGIDRVHAVRAD